MQRNHKVGAELDVVVIGGGLAGLIAAVELARGGRSVALFEKSRNVGGRAMTTRRGEVDWNLGAHALYRAGNAARILDDLGISFSGGMPRASGGYAIAGGRKHALPGGFVSLLSTSLLRLPAKLELASLLSSLPRIDSNDALDVTLDEWLVRRTRHEGVRSLMRALARLTTYCDAPDDVVAGDIIAQIQMALATNVLYVDGGWQTLVDGLRAAANAAGVCIVEGATVRSIDAAGVVQGIRLEDGDLVQARSVVAAVPPDVVVRLVPTLEARVRDALERCVPVRAACLDVTLSSLPVANATFALGIDRPLYFSVHSAIARLAPAPTAVIHLMKYLRPGADAGNARSIEGELEAVLDLVQPTWRAKVVDRRFLPSMIVSHALPSALQGGLRGRPSVDVTGIPGVYVCGDWVGERGFIADAAAASARAAASSCRAHLDQHATRAA